MFGDQQACTDGRAERKQAQYMNRVLPATHLPYTAFVAPFEGGGASSPIDVSAHVRVSNISELTVQCRPCAVPSWCEPLWEVVQLRAPRDY